MFKRQSVVLDFTDTIDMCCQEFEPECNINTIFDRCTKRGLSVEELGDKESLVYADVSEVGDFQSQQDRIVKGKDIFESMPHKLKEKFGNNVQLLFKFMENHSNEEVAEILGIDVSALHQANSQSKPNEDVGEGADKSAPDATEQPVKPADEGVE